MLRVRIQTLRHGFQGCSCPVAWRASCSTPQARGVHVLMTMKPCTLDGGQDQRRVGRRQWLAVVAGCHAA
jgi:hypothetical protein